MHVIVAYSMLPRHAEDVVSALRSTGAITATMMDSDHVLSMLPSYAETDGRVDAVIVLDQFGDSLPLVNAIRRLDEKLTFKGVVRVRTVPVLVAYTGYANDNVPQLGDPIPEWWNGQITVTPDDLPPWTTVIQSPRRSWWPSHVMDAVRSWRESLLAELDYVGFTVSEGPTGGLAISHALRRKRREGEILAPEGTPGALRRGQYLILAQDYLAACDVLTEFQWNLEHYESIAAREGIKPETVFQRFFEQHPHLVKRSLFDAVWSKPTLRRFEEPGKSYQPDFVLRPSVGAHIGTNWEVLDLKLPDVGLHTDRFHPRYTAKLISAMTQLRNYRNYFSRQDTQTREELRSQFGFQPSHPRIAVLIGRREREEGLADVQGAAQDLDIDIITYDDIVEFEENRLVLNGNLSGIFAHRL